MIFFSWLGAGTGDVQENSPSGPQLGGDQPSRDYGGERVHHRGDPGTLQEQLHLILRGRGLNLFG